MAYYVFLFLFVVFILLHCFGKLMSPITVTMAHSHSNKMFELDVRIGILRIVKVLKGSLRWSVISMIMPSIL